MDHKIFRKKSLEKVSSPEQLNDYVRVSNPSVWMIMVGVIILLIGVCVWGIFGRLDTQISTVGVCKDGVLTCYVKEENISSVKEGMTLEADGQQLKVEGISREASQDTNEMSDYTLHVGNLQKGEWVYHVTTPADLDDGTYNVKITTESIAPMSFVLN
ncbi:MAG: hypothetical protein PUC32_01750 [Oscillospiraceae bacterium]|nr:hypothetical protein [Oscillospiraceae bacterium]